MIDFATLEGFKNTQGELVAHCRAVRDLAEAEQIQEVREMLHAAADYLGAVSQKAFWLRGFVEHKDGSALKNACFAGGYMLAVNAQYVRKFGALGNTTIAEFEYHRKFIEDVSASVDKMVEDIMQYFVQVHKPE